MEWPVLQSESPHLPRPLSLCSVPQEPGSMPEWGRGQETAELWAHRASSARLTPARPTVSSGSLCLAEA